MIWHGCMILWKLPGSCLKPHEGHEAMRPTSTLLTSVGPCSVCIGTYARYDSVWSSHKVTLMCIYIYTYNIHPAKATFSYLPAWSDVTRSIPSLALHKLYMVRIVSDWVPLPLSLPFYAILCVLMVSPSLKMWSPGYVCVLCHLSHFARFVALCRTLSRANWGTPTGAVPEMLSPDFVQTPGVLLAPQALQVPVSAGGDKVLHQWLDEDKQVVRKAGDQVDEVLSSVSR
jgi:hypothetical protein